MSRRILLWKPKLARTSDEAGTDILKYELPASIPGPYEEVSKFAAKESLTYVPSLKALCIRQLASYPDQLDWLGSFRAHYELPKSPSDYDLVRSLVPGYSHENPNEIAFMRDVDPRLWAVMVQTISPLPDAFRSYTIPLSDTYVPLMQQVPCTPDFSLITVVQLHGKREVDDETIDQLGALHSLVALDVGCTPLSSWGFKRLSHTLLTDKFTGNRRGPWSLRILYLWNCMLVDDSVFEALAKFPLLSVVDLRGTMCKPSSVQTTTFGPPPESELFHPTQLPIALRNLSSLSAKANAQAQPTLFSHPKPYILYIPTLQHTSSKSRDPFASLDCMPSRRTRPNRGRDILDNYLGSPQEIAARRSSNLTDSLPPSSSNQHPLMLFRSPPSYDTNLSSSSLTTQSPSSRRSLKRYHSEEATKKLYGEQARSSKRARESVQSVMNLVGKKVGIVTPAAGPSNPARDVRDNPFLRRSLPISGATMHSGIDPDLLASAERDRIATRSLSKVALSKQPRRPFPSGDGLKEAPRPRYTSSASSRPSVTPSIDPALLASVEADRRKEAEKERKKYKVQMKSTKKYNGPSSHSDSDLSSSSDDGPECKDELSASPSGGKKSQIRLAPTTAPPEKLKPLTALPIPQLPPELHRKGYTEAEKAILLGTKAKRRKSDEPANGLKQLTLAAFTRSASSTSGPLSIGSRRLGSTKKAVVDMNRR